ncbi:MAG: ABC transporter permease [Lachnospiraceae bacterium]|nr:ABC transporter permease [Lachnospiraceae bacterium]
MNVSNRKCIRRLSVASFKAAKVRNIITIAAIALTTILFTVIFTVAMSIKHGFEQSNFRQVGGYSHGGFKYLTEEQFEELKDDPLIKEYGFRIFCGMPEKAPFHRSHVEVSYCDKNEAKWMFVEPKEGRLPKEGTNEAATDLRVLSLLGVEPVIGNEFTMTFLVDGTETTETFTLCGYWDYDDVIVANHVLIPRSRTQEIFDKLDTQGIDGMTGSYNMDVMFKNASHIEENLKTILERHGYQAEGKDLGDNFIPIGVNWGYVSSQFEDGIDLETILALSVIILLIIFTGYLIIYNIFQISVSNDVRFYGLLKTIGTTGRQIKRIISQQALLLSALGIPIGLALGYGAGVIMTGIVVSQLSGVTLTYSVSPVIFLGSAAFSLVTVWLSCRKPRSMAAKISPVEAVRYTEGNGTKKKSRKGEKGASIFRMAIANLGRNKSKTVITVISMSFAVVILNLTFMFANGFDMDKYLSNVAVDFITAEAPYFQTSGETGAPFPEEMIAQMEALDGVKGGRTYRHDVREAQQLVTEEWMRKRMGTWNSPETVDRMVEWKEKVGDLCSDDVQLYGMEDFVLDKLNVLEGDINKLKEGGNYVAAVYHADEYGNIFEDWNYAKLGDQITIRYVKEYEYYNPETGEIYEEGENVGERPWRQRAKVYDEKVYEVAALVEVPTSLSYRATWSDEFVLGAETSIRDSGTSDVLYYAFDCEDDKLDAAEEWMHNFAGSDDSEFDYESRKTYEEDFEGFRSMFLMVGGGAALIVGLVGILNFLNAILTGIMTRRREFAVLQSVGMTGKQLNRMLITEGMVFAGSSVVVTLILTVVTGPLASSVMESLFWFFRYRLTVAPILLVAPAFLAIGAVIPLVSYYYVAKRSVVERLREAE